MYTLLKIITLVCLIGFCIGLPIRMDASGRGDGGIHRGWATYYDVEKGRGACGWTNKNNDHVFAMGKDLWDNMSHDGPAKSCGKSATVTWRGKSVRATAVDLCPACGFSNIDLSPSAFEQLADKDVGRLDGVSWKFD